MSSQSTKEITICLGSSCFARGNARNLEVLQELLRKKGLLGEVSVRGELCQGCCSQGPNLMVDKTAIHAVDPVVILDLVDSQLAPGGNPR